MMETWSNAYALLLAGGKGTRFWPLSREDHPKQLLKLFSDKSLVEETYSRVLPVIPCERIFVATSETLVTRLMNMFPRVPDENFVVEPVPKNTAPCIAVACQRLVNRDPDAILLVLPSDHYVSDNDEFLEVLQSAVGYARQGKIVMLGITPTHPETGYGYIRCGEPTNGSTDPLVKHKAREIVAFIEKPKLDAAATYLREGCYLWNSGIFVFKAKVMLEKVQLHLPDLMAKVEELAEAEKRGADPDTLVKIWGQMPDISIDYGIMERASGLVVIPASFGWSDVGSWKALSSFPSDDQGNFVHGRVLAIESAGNVLYSSHGFLAVIGLRDTVVVVTRGAVLVCHLERTQDVKALVAELKNRGYDELL